MNNNDSKVTTALQFYSLVMQDPSLQNEFIGLSSEADVFELAVELGKKNGYDFGIDDIKIAVSNEENFSDDAELNDNLLAAVAGGKDSASLSSGSIFA